MFLKFFMLLVLIALSISADRENSSISNSQNTCTIPKLANGVLTQHNESGMTHFICNKGYTQVRGGGTMKCKSGRWSTIKSKLLPICIKSGCPNIASPENGNVNYFVKNALADLFCEINYEVVGSKYAYCNGTHWDRDVGTCREIKSAPATSCDFEGDSICGWEQVRFSRIHFHRESGSHKEIVQLVTGPNADHTTGISNQGHYMVMNTIGEDSNKKAQLISPPYRIIAEKLCFKFYYHMFGNGIGTLRVYAKPESVDVQDVLLFESGRDFIIFEKIGDQGNSWHKGIGALKSNNSESSFQIIIEAISGETGLSDIAFDDISILSDDECIEGDLNVTETKNDINE